MSWRAGNRRTQNERQRYANRRQTADPASPEAGDRRSRFDLRPSSGDAGQGDPDQSRAEKSGTEKGRAEKSRCLQEAKNPRSLSCGVQVAATGAERPRRRRPLPERRPSLAGLISI